MLVVFLSLTISLAVVAPNPCPALYSAVALVAVVSVLIWFSWPFAWVGPFSIAAMNHYRTYPIRWFHVAVVFRSPFPNRLRQTDNFRTVLRPHCCCILDCTYRMNRSCYWPRCLYPGCSANSNRYCMDSKWLQSMGQNLRWMKIYFSLNCHRMRHCNQKNWRKNKKNTKITWLVVFWFFRRKNQAKN